MTPGSIKEINADNQAKWKLPDSLFFFSIYNLHSVKCTNLSVELDDFFLFY